MRVLAVASLGAGLALQALEAAAFAAAPGATALTVSNGHHCPHCRRRSELTMVVQSRGGGGSGGAKKGKKDKDMEKAVRTFQVMEDRKEKKKERKKQLRESSAPSLAASRQGRGIRANPLRPVAQTEAAAAAAGRKKKPMPSPFEAEAKMTTKFNVADLTGVEFIGSYAEDENAWPSEAVPEVAFLGRSNVGKSSMLNCLFGERAAKVSKTPGRTQLINIFSARGGAGGARELCRFADLPGYGYAKLAKEDMRAIEGFLMQYLERRAQLKLLILLVDARRDALDSDAEILDFAADMGVGFRVLVVATKVDKLSAMEAALNLARIRDGFGLPEELPLPFSAVTGQGRKEVWQYIREACEMDRRKQ